MSRPNRWQEQILRQDDEIKELRSNLRRVISDMPHSYREAIEYGKKQECERWERSIPFKTLGPGIDE